MVSGMAIPHDHEWYFSSHDGFRNHGTGLYFYPENWGNGPIWRADFSNGLKLPTSFTIRQWKANIEPENHPIEKDNHLPSTSIFGFHVDFFRLYGIIELILFFLECEMLSTPSPVKLIRPTWVTSLAHRNFKEIRVKNMFFTNIIYIYPGSPSRPNFAPWWDRESWLHGSS